MKLLNQSSSQVSFNSSSVKTQSIPVDSPKEDDQFPFMSNDERRDDNQDEEEEARITEERLCKRLFLTIEKNNLPEFTSLIESEDSLLYATDDRGNSLIDSIISHHQDEGVNKDYTDMVSYLIYYGAPQTNSPYQTAVELAQSLSNKTKLVPLLQQAERKELQKIIQHSLDQFFINNGLLKNQEREKEQTSNPFTISDNRHYYWQVSSELIKLQSFCLADTWLGSEELIDYLARKMHGHAQVAVAVTAWSTGLKEDGFPYESFLDFLSDSSKSIFLLPLIHERHFCGLVFRKQKPPHFLEIEYFNPSTYAAEPGGNDNHNLEQVKTILFDMMGQICASSSKIHGIKVTLDSSLSQIIVKQFSTLSSCNQIDIINSSHQQQFNGSDCGYIVAQTLIEKALKLPTSISSYTTVNAADYVRSIAQARAHFYNPAVWQKDADELIRKQYLWRLTIALTWLESEVKSLRKLILLVSSMSSADNLVFQALKAIVTELETDLLKNKSLNQVPELVLNRLKEKTSNYTLEAIQGFCDKLLQPSFAERGDPLFIANIELLKHLPIGIRNQFPALVDKPHLSHQQQTDNHPSSIYSLASYPHAVSAITNTAYSKLINVSSQDNNCALFALALGTKLILAKKPELNTLVHVPTFVLEFPIELLIASSHEILLDQEKEARLTSFGLTLCQELAAALRNNTPYKTKRYENFLAICIQRLKGDSSPLPQEVTSLFQPSAAEAFLSSLKARWEALQKALSFDSAVIEEYRSLVDKVSLCEEEIAEFYRELTNLLQLEQMDSVGEIFERLPEQSTDPLQKLIRKHKLYQVAWSRITSEGNEEKQELFAEKVRKYFLREARTLISLQDSVSVISLEKVSLLNQTSFASNGEISNISTHYLLETSIGYFAEFVLLSEWETIFGIYCQEIEKNTVMLTSEELGELAKRWEVQLTINSQDSTRPYQSFEQLKSEMLQVTLFNPINREDDSRIHWQVMTNTIPCLLELMDNTSNDSDSGPPITEYKLWFLRFFCVLNVYRASPFDNLEEFQLFILNAGQYNANFILNELRRLKYPLSPLAVMHAHTYIRSTETWAMEMLNLEYQKKIKNPQLFPVFVDSELFWAELDRYCTVLKGANIILNTNSIQLFENPVFVELENSQIGNANQHKRRIQQELRKQFRPIVMEFFAQQKNIDSQLIKYLKKLMPGKPCNELFKSNREFLETIKMLFPEITIPVSIKAIFKYLLSNNKVTLTINKLWVDIFDIIFLKKADNNKFSHNTSEMEVKLDYNIQNDVWFKRIFELLKKYKCNLPGGIKTYSDLNELSKRDYNQFLTLLVSLFEAIAYQHIGKVWLEVYITPQIDKLLKKTVYFFKDKYKDIDTMVFCEIDKEGLPGFVVSILGNLGYRIDPVRAIREVLKLFPKLFIDVTNTKAFWDQLLQLAMITKLPENEREVIKQLGKNVVSQIAFLDLVINDVFSNEEDEEDEDEDKIYPKIVEKVNIEQIVIALLEYDYASSEIGIVFVVKYIKDSYLKNLPESIIRQVCDFEIKLALSEIKFCLAYNFNIVKIIKYLQIITDVLILDLSINPHDQDISKIVSNLYLPTFPVRHVSLTPYAMRAYVRVFQVLDGLYAKDEKLKIIVTNQSYFEWLRNLERIEHKNATVLYVQHLDDIGEQVDIIFLEFHPNNVVESRQFQHNIASLVKIMKNWDNVNRRTIVIDATLNALNDQEVKKFLQQTSELVDKGLVNIIFVQSLTKFYQLGLDKRSAGALTVINNNMNLWQKLNTKLEAFKLQEKIDSSTLSFFAYFLSYHKIHEVYINLINYNVNVLYTHVIDRINTLGILDKNRLQITISSDDAACYIAMNMNHLLSDADPSLEMSLHKIEGFTEDVLHYFIIPIFEGLNLPLTERMSIGFPLTSVGAVYTSLRFTVGLEAENLYDYADILAYVSFILNNEDDLALFFDDTKGPIDSKKPENLVSYALRKHYFRLKANLFIAMTPKSNHNYSVYFNQSGTVVSSVDEDINPYEEGHIALHIYNGIPRFEKCTDPQDGIHVECFNNISILIKGSLTSFLDLDYNQKRFYIGSISPFYSRNQKNKLVNKLLFDDNERNVILNCVHEFDNSTIPTIFGPFNHQFGPLYFYRQNQFLFCHLGEQVYQLNREGLLQALMPDICFIKQGHMVNTLSAMPIEEWDYFFRVGAYDSSCVPLQTAPEDFQAAKIQYIPSNPDGVDIRIILNTETRKIRLLGLQKDYRSVYFKNGVSVYKRYISQNYTCYEIDYWCEKRPVYARFFRLMTAILVKEFNSDSIHFSAYNHYYFRFLFNLNYEESDKLFSEAILSILRCFRKLIMLLDESVDDSKQGSAEPLETYLFSKDLPLIWPTDNLGVNFLANAKLILAALAILKKDLYYVNQSPCALIVRYGNHALNLNTSIEVASSNMRWSFQQIESAIGNLLDPLLSEATERASNGESGYSYDASIVNGIAKFYYDSCQSFWQRPVNLRDDIIKSEESDLMPKNT